MKRNTLRPKISKDQISLPYININPDSNVPSSSLRSLVTTGSHKNRPDPEIVDRIKDLKTDSYFDASASIAGSPLDPRVYHVLQKPSNMSLHQLESLQQAVSAFKRQIAAMSSATETFIMALQNLSEVAHLSSSSSSDVSGEQEIAPQLQDLDYFIDTLHIVSNAHSNWANALEDEIEVPVIEEIRQLSEKTRIIQEKSQKGINSLLKQMSLDDAKKTSHEQNMKRQLSIANEIKRIDQENKEYQFRLTERSAKKVISICAFGTRSQNETYSRLAEGLRKVEKPIKKASVSSSPRMSQQTSKRVNLATDTRSVISSPERDVKPSLRSRTPSSPNLDKSPMPSPSKLGHPKSPVLDKPTLRSPLSRGSLHTEDLRKLMGKLDDRFY